MKITPLDIRQRTFSRKTFGGIDPEEVEGYLNSLSKEWERTLDENKELRIRLEGAEHQLLKLREVESSLYLTLKTAEDTGNNLIEQANKTAQLNLRDSQLRSDALVKDAKWQARKIMEEAEEEARKTFRTLQQEVKNLEQEYRSIENLRDNLMGELKNLTHDVMDKVERINIRNNKVVFIAPSTPQVLEQRGSGIIPEHSPANSIDVEPEIDDTTKGTSGPGDETKNRSQGSFFDNI
jgi:cell division initiation protein